MRMESWSGERTREHGHRPDGAARRVTRGALALALCLGALTACQSLSDVKPGAGRSAVITDRSYDEVWAASLKAAERNFSVHDQSKPEGVILGEQAGMGGGWFGIFLTGAGANAYRVEVVRADKYYGQIAWTDWPGRILRAIQAELTAAPAP